MLHPCSCSNKKQVAANKRPTQPPFHISASFTWSTMINIPDLLKVVRFTKWQLAANKRSTSLTFHKSAGKQCPRSRVCVQCDLPWKSKNEMHQSPIIDTNHQSSTQSHKIWCQIRNEGLTVKGFTLIMFYWKLKSIIVQKQTSILNKDKRRIQLFLNLSDLLPVQCS